MFSETPLFGTAEANHDPTPVWSLYVFLVTDRESQLRILRALLDLGRDGITGLGTHRGSENFVIVDYSNDADRAHARRVVNTIDPSATITFTGRKRQIARNA
ncbi:MAG: hypothetical protein JWR83_1932 [Aeromicrobium sp.]|nr:hypothetical protein [Aeromicrobium sp.]